MVPIPFADGAYTSDSLNISAQRCLNLYPEINQYNSKAIVSLKSTPGLKLFTNLTGAGAMRGLYTTSNGRFFGVCANKVSEINSIGVATVIGTISSTSGIVRMSDNGIDMILVDGDSGQGWTYTFSTGAFAQITDSAYPGGTHVAFINQRYLVNDPDTQQYYWSALADGTNWTGGGVASAESNPDNINALIALGGELWSFGPLSYEVAYNTETIFTLIQGTPKDVGCFAPDSLAKSDSNVFWLGGDENGHGVVHTNEGYQARRISTHAIEQIIQGYSKIDDAIGYCYQQLGHDFYVLSFPTAKTTWCYDASTDRWHERNYTATDVNFVDTSFMHKGIVQEFFNGKVYVGDWGDGNIYELDPKTYTDNGDAIHRERSSPHVWNNLDRAFYGSFQLDVESGVGLNGDGQGSNPQIMMDISDDGGHTYGNEYWESAGKLGEYKARVKWDRLGASRDRVFRVKMTDPVKWVILGAYVEVE